MPIPTGRDAKVWLKGRNKFMTGFCNDNGKPGQHEGQKPKSFSGKPLPTCEFAASCPCECHMLLDNMFKVTNMERKLVPNPEYAPERGEFVMPDFAENPLADPALAFGGVIGTPDVERRVAVPASTAAAPLATRRTETGRAARGGLEAQVWDACFNMPEDLGDLTPKMIVEWIATQYNIPTPSTGAVNAVWERWLKLGFCELGKKPNRFLGFVNDGTWEELARLKGSVKRQEKSAATAARLGRR